MITKLGALFMGIHNKLLLLLLLFIKLAFKGTLLKQINSIKTVLKRC